ncbi:MAG TPA: hypothetical protein VN667_02945 [Burkholderiales bacterium]|nr:hypothetical protein [Burkholderiales bacterium]
MKRLSHLLFALLLAWALSAPAQILPGILAAPAAVVSVGTVSLNNNNSGSILYAASNTVSGAQSVTAGGTHTVAFAYVKVRYLSGTPTITSVTYNGASMTLGCQTLDATNHYRTAVYYLVAPATGSNTLAATGDANVTNIYASLASYNGVDQTTPIRACATPFTGTSSSTNSITVASDANDLTSTLASDGNNTITSTNQTSDGITNTGCCDLGLDHATTAAASVTHTWTWATGVGTAAIIGWSIKHD